VGFALGLVFAAMPALAGEAALLVTFFVGLVIDATGLSTALFGGVFFFASAAFTGLTKSERQRIQWRIFV